MVKWLRQFETVILVLTMLKEQYPVTAHAPNFDFWTGCREIERCEESKGTLKNSLGRVQHYTKTSQDYRSMMYCSR